MKKITFILVALFVTSLAVAQKGKLRSAKSAYEDGNYQEAYEDIQEVAQHKKTKDNPETWVFKALIESGIQQTGLDQMLGIELSPDDITNSLDKAMELDESGDYSDLMAQAAETLISNAHNAGVQAYSKDKDYQTAVDMFLKKHALQKKYTPDAPKDTIGYVVIGSSYINLDQQEKAIPYYEKAVNLGYEDQGMYNALITYYQKKENDDKFLSYLQKAQEVYPDVQNYKLMEIDYYVKNGQAEEKIDELKAAAKENPDNTGIKLILSGIYESQENFAKQAEWAQKAVESDPENFAANFNAGVANFNQAVKFNDELNFMDTTESDEYKEAKSKRDQFADKALNYFEKAKSIEPSNPSVTQALIQYHTMYGNDAKVKELTQELGGNQ